MASTSEPQVEIKKAGAEIPETGWAFHDGEFKALADAHVSIATHALNYGTGIFEGIRAYWNAREEQLYVFRLREHFVRMSQSCRILRIELPGDPDALAAITVELLRRGHRVGVTAQSHKVILKLMDDVVAAMDRAGFSAPVYKVKGSDEEPLPEGSPIRVIGSRDTAGVLGDGAVLVGGTAWAFSRPELGAALDYIVIDEAGQFSLANAVAVGLSTRNLILVGDQMQLPQVTQGHHPGDTGRSCLEYVLQGQQAVSAERGVFLDASRRMHPDLCRFVSDAVYQRRLGSIPETGRHRVLRAADTVLVPKETGLAWVPIDHDDCTQASEEECDAIEAIVAELLRRRVVDQTGVERPMTREDILVVAPFNLQVRCLRQRLPGIRIGSVDKFQGQEAPVVVVSLCASTLEEAPRGASFLLSPNRLNVAVSRAQALAIVVGSPALLNVRCRSVEEMELVNLLCHLVDYAEGRA